jgi:hypothetical protein
MRLSNQKFYDFSSNPTSHTTSASTSTISSNLSGRKTDIMIKDKKNFSRTSYSRTQSQKTAIVIFKTRRQEYAHE